MWQSAHGNIGASVFKDEGENQILGTPAVSAARKVSLDPSQSRGPSQLHCSYHVAFHKRNAIAIENSVWL